MLKTTILFTLTLLTGSALAADAPKDEVIKAAKALGEKPNYSWKSTVESPGGGGQFRPGPTEGKTEKDGVTHVTMSFGDNKTEAVLKGDKAAVTNRDGEWQSAAELENAEGQGRFLGAMARNIQTPAVQAAELASQAKELKKDGDVISGPLTEEAAKNLMRFRRRGGQGGPTINSAAGYARFWVKDGVLSKYEYKVDGSMQRNNEDVDIQRTTTVEIKDVGSTKVEVPEGAKKKLS